VWTTKKSRELKWSIGSFGRGKKSGLLFSKNAERAAKTQSLHYSRIKQWTASDANKEAQSKDVKEHRAAEERISWKRESDAQSERKKEAYLLNQQGVMY